jgi:hypothetical protein
METVFGLMWYPKLGTCGADMFSLQTVMRWVSRRNIVNPKAEPKVPETVRRIPRKQFDAVMSGAKAVMRELTEFAEQAKSRLREDRPIKQDDLLELVQKLVATQKRIDAEMEADVAKSADTGDTEWDRRSYNLFAVPTSRMANAPQAIVDLTLAAENNGAKDMKLLYELTVAEMDVRVAHFNVTLNSIPEEGLPIRR